MVSIKNVNPLYLDAEGFIKQLYNHFLDNDLYAYTMANAAQRMSPDTVTEDELIIRKSFKITEEFVNELKRQINFFPSLFLSDEDEEKFQKACYYLPKTFMKWLKAYRYDPSELTIWAEGNVLKIKIKGLFCRTVFWETPLMALISELFFLMSGEVPDAEYIHRAEQKGLRLRQIGARYSEFGTRRRFSFEVQKNVLEALIRTSGLLKDGGVLVGTSNVYLALLFGITPTGTNAHKWYQLCAGLFGVRMANRMALQWWSEVYGTYLGTALTDTYTTDDFIKTFDRHDAMLYESVRQDSGDPFEYVRKILKAYEDLLIRPITKTILFSDSLNIDLVEKIVAFCAGKINCAFGIGTSLSNDIIGVEPLKIVIKQIAVWLQDGRRVGTCKISDDPEKASGAQEVVWHTKYELGILQ